MIHWMPQTCFTDVTRSILLHHSQDDAHEKEILWFLKDMKYEVAIPEHYLQALEPFPMTHTSLH